MKVLPLRLQPGADLRRVMEAWIAEKEEQAGCVISAVGSLSVAQLRFAGATEATVIRGDLEILSLAGTLSPDSDRPAAGLAVQPGAGSGHRPRRAADQGSARAVIARRVSSKSGSSCWLA